MNVQYKKRFYIHLGIHKTGSTQFQNFFSANKKNLASERIGFFRYGDLQEDYTKKYIYKGLNSEGGAWISSYTLDFDIVILSNEDFMGNYSVFQEGEPYSQRINYLENIIATLPPDSEVILMICFREYSEWIESCYLQFLKYRAKGVISFDKYLDDIDFEKLNWFSVINDLSRLYGVSAIQCWSYEWFRDNNINLYYFYEKELGMNLQRPVSSKVANPSYSSVAYHLLMASNGMKDVDRKKLNRFIRKNFTISNGYEKPVFFSNTTKTLLRLKYKSDLEKIAKINSEKFFFIENL